MMAEVQVVLKILVSRELAVQFQILILEVPYEVTVEKSEQKVEMMVILLTVMDAQILVQLSLAILAQEVVSRLLILEKIYEEMAN